MLIKKIKTCRVCGSDHLVPILSLGKQFVTNFVEDPEQKAYKAPLDLVLCDPKHGGCGLLQMRHTFNHDVLYRKYWYRSGISTSMVKALADIADKAERLVRLSKGDVVIDIGSSDGTLLNQYKTEGIMRIGFEPSNFWALAKSNKYNKTMHDYFNYNSFRKAIGKRVNRKASIITSIAMFYDLQAPNRFVEDIKRCLDKNGVWIIQMNYLGLMFQNNTFDNISHEHLEFYSLFSLEYLLNRHKLEVFDVELNDVNGGSFRVYIKFKGARIKAFAGASRRLNDLRRKEKRMMLDTKKPYVAFAKRINKIRSDLFNLLTTLKKSGKRVFIYGASTRGLVQLQYAGIDKKLISKATDKNPDKHGRYIVGTGIPIVSIEEYRRARPDYLFVLPYHFISEIKNQEREFLNSGGRMIVAIPSVKIISKRDE